MNEHEKAARYADLHEHRLQLLGEIAGIPATKRQASKFNNGRGLAFRFAR